MMWFKTAYPVDIVLKRIKFEIHTSLGSYIAIIVPSHTSLMDCMGLGFKEGSQVEQHTAVKRHARAQFPPKLLHTNLKNFRKLSPKAKSQRRSWEVKVYTLLMHWKIYNCSPLSFPAWNFLSFYYFFKNFLQKLEDFRVKLLEKIEVPKTGGDDIFAFDRCEVEQWSLGLTSLAGFLFRSVRLHGSMFAG